MFRAAREGDLKKVKRLVKGGHDVNQRDEEERTPLMWAAMKGRTDCVEFLLQNGAQLDLKDKDGMTALHLAAYGGHLEVMKRLIEAGHDVNQRDKEITPLMFAAALGHTDCVEYLLQNGAELDVFTAAMIGDVEKMKSLVEGGQDVNQRDWEERTPLMWAAREGHTDCVKYLIQNGAEMDVFTAAMIGDMAEIKRLVEAGHDVNQRDEWERTPLMWAAREGHTDCVKYLLQNGAQLDLTDHVGNTALHLAAEGGHLEVLKRLVEAGQDVNQRDGWFKRTPLMRAAVEGHTDCVEYLIQNGAQLNLKDYERKTPLMRAAMEGRTDCVKYLLQNGAQLDLTDHVGNTALHLAAEGGHLEVLKRLVEAGQDVNQRDGWFKRTPLMRAAVEGHTDCVEYLIQNGAQLDLKEISGLFGIMFGKTALQLASEEGHDSTVKLLQAATPKGRTYTKSHCIVCIVSILLCSPHNYWGGGTTKVNQVTFVAIFVNKCTCHTKRKMAACDTDLLDFFFDKN